MAALVALKDAFESAAGGTAILQHKDGFAHKIGDTYFAHYAGSHTQYRTCDALFEALDREWKDPMLRSDGWRIRRRIHGQLQDVTQEERAAFNALLGDLQIDL